MNTLRVADLDDGRKAIEQDSVAEIVEEWKTFPLHEGYKISSLGKVIGPRGDIKPSLNSNGYLTFKYWHKGKGKSTLLHRAVCRTFHGKAPSDKPHSLHKNHIKTDCRASNLYWGNDLDNSNDKIKAGRDNKSRGINHYMSKVTPAEVVSIRHDYDSGKKSLSELAREYQVTAANIQAIVTRKTWRHI